MIRRYCFSCGAPLARTETRPAGVCPRCALAGDHLPADRRRWQIRTVEGGSRGPLSREALVDQLLRGALSPADMAARSGGRWMPLIEHPDLQSFFLPGANDATRLEGSKTARKRERRTDDLRRTVRIGASIAFAAASIGLAVFAWQTDALVIPQDTIDEVTGFFGSTSSAVSSQVTRAVDPRAAARDAARRRTLPAGEVLDSLRQKWPNAAGASHLRLHRGLQGLWTGTEASLDEAREHIEQAVVLAPDEIEAWAALAELYSLKLVDEPELSDALVLAVDRCLALSPDATSSLRAASMSAFAHGNRGSAADLANRCASAPGSAGKPGSSSDLGCALVTAEAQSLISDLEALHDRFDGHLRVGLPYARVLVEKQRYRDGVEVAEKLRNRHPKEVGPLGVLLDAHIALGQWEDARKAGRRAVDLAPHRIDLKIKLAEVLLKVDGAARPAFELYRDAVAHKRFSAYENRPRALGDAASAAIAAGKYEEAVAFADAAIAIAERDPIAGLQKARALQRLGRTQESEALLRSTEPTSLSGHDLAAWHVAAASFYIEAGRERLAETELRSAGETDPFWPGTPITAARNRLGVGDREGAISFLEQAAYMDLYMDTARDPLQLVWTEAPDWRSFRIAMQDELLGDARFASRGHGVIGVVAIYAGMSDARRVLERALVGGAPAPAANAALAQYHMHRGNTSLALKHTSQVVETSTNPGILYGVRGRAMARDGKAAQSRAAFVQALEKAPNEATLYRWRAEAQREGEDRRGAQKSLGEALRLMPDDLRSRVLLVDLKRDSP